MNNAERRNTRWQNPKEDVPYGTFPHAAEALVLPVIAQELNFYIRE